MGYCDNGYWIPDYEGDEEPYSGYCSGIGAPSPMPGLPPIVPVKPAPPPSYPTLPPFLPPIFGPDPVITPPVPVNPPTLPPAPPMPGQPVPAVGAVLPLLIKAAPWLIAAFPWLLEAMGGEIPSLIPQVPSPYGGGTVPALPPGNGGTGPPPGWVGPGVPEPPGYMVTKRWESRVYDKKLGYVKMNFYALSNGKVAMYHNYKKYWKIWRPKKNIVLSSNPRIKDLTKFNRAHAKMVKAVKKLVPKVRVTSTQAPSRFLSAVERKQLTAGK